MMSCEKEAIKMATDEQTINPSVEKIEGKRYTTIACETVDPDGTAGIGTRCRKAKGDDCKKETECEAVALPSRFVLPDGWTLDDFNNAWNTEDGKSYLEGLGYYQRDLE